MNTTIRNRLAALGVAAVAGLAGGAVAGGPALASPNADAATTAVQQSQSADDATNAVTYADQLVIAWGNGSTDVVESHADESVVDTLSAHGNAHATHWDRVGSEGAAGTTYVDYENTVTGEQLSVGVASAAVANGEDKAVHTIKFSD